MNRREFIKNSCGACSYLALAASLPNLLACGSALELYKTEVINQSIALPLHLFQQNKIQYVRVKNWDYDLVVHQQEDKTFRAFLLQCTHMANPLIPSAQGYACSLHGSQFSLNGQVLKGPARTNLKEFATHIQNDSLLIAL